MAALLPPRRPFTADLALVVVVMIVGEQEVDTVGSIR